MDVKVRKTRLGRPPLSEDGPAKQHTITMPDADFRLAREMGDGNASAGLRIAVRMAYDRWAQHRYYQRRKADES